MHHPHFITIFQTWKDVESLNQYIVAFLNRKFAGNSLPPVMGLSNDRLPHTGGMEISLDTDAVVQTIREEALRIAKAKAS